MCTFNPVVPGYLGGLMHDGVGIPYYFEIIILILRTAFFYDCNTQHQRCCGLESENTYAHCHHSLQCLVYALQMSFCISFHEDVWVFKLYDNIDIFVILPLWQMFNKLEGKKVSSKNVAGFKR